MTPSLHFGRVGTGRSVTRVQVFATIVQTALYRSGYLSPGIHAMFFTRLFRQYSRTMRERLGGDSPDQTYLFELFLFLLLVVLLVVGIAWM